MLLISGAKLKTPLQSYNGRALCNPRTPQVSYLDDFLLVTLKYLDDCLLVALTYLDDFLLFAFSYLDDLVVVTKYNTVTIYQLIDHSYYSKDKGLDILRTVFSYLFSQCQHTPRGLQGLKEINKTNIITLTKTQFIILLWQGCNDKRTVLTNAAAMGGFCCQNGKSISDKLQVS